MTIKERIMREGGLILKDIFDQITSQMRPGLTLKLLDDKASELLNYYNAKSGLRLQGFPTNLAISLNEEVIQGIPNDRVISEGDLISLDMTLYYKGFFIDKAVSLTVDPSHYSKRYLITAVKQCFDSAFSFLNSQIKITGKLPTWSIGKVIEQQAKALGITTTSKLSGHGIGEEPHMKPIVPNTFHLKFDDLLKPGMFITIEPIVFYTKVSNIHFDGFLVNSKDLSAHWEDTIAITEEGAEVIT